jgi:hypothetical protein
MAPGFLYGFKLKKPVTTATGFRIYKRKALLERSVVIRVTLLNYSDDSGLGFFIIAQHKPIDKNAIGQVVFKL